MDVAHRGHLRAGRGARTARALGAGLVAVALVLAGPAALAADGVPPAPAAPVLEPVDFFGAAPMPTTAALKQATRAALRAPALGTPGAVVVDVASGQTLLSVRASTARIPASTIKLLTAAAALTTLGPSTRIATRVVREGDVITIIGGGDATLVTRKGGNPLAGGSASLADLAAQVAAKVTGSQSSGTQPSGPVRLRFDDSLFTGPRLGPGWKSSFPAGGIAAPVVALMVDGGRTTPAATRRVDDPARRAAQVFATELRRAGLDVRGVKRASAPATASEIARVESAPVGDLVERMLTESDNDLAESLAHLVGSAAGDGASFAGGAQAVHDAVRALGVDMTSVRIVDGSGLSRRNAVTPIALAAVIDAAAGGSTPALGAIIAGLPVAGVSGTLADRYGTSAQRDAAGYVHAKTGTLTGVIALAGTVQDVDGRVLAFALISDDTGSTEAARKAADDFATVLASCGCS